MSRASEHAVALEHVCSREDLTEVGLSEMGKTFVLLGNESPAPCPLAGSGYDVWEDTLAHMGVLTAPNQRGQGHAATAVSIAVNHAAESGLIPQWRARTDNTASIRTALSAGFLHAGSQTTVLLGATSNRPTAGGSPPWCSEPRFLCWGS
ncbi:GNAT family N-acetyltransferase [Arthrobacter sp. ATA002]|uniref:GNAT family N-acetyltransferase n=1 Tax=Arthrobacter sp. ATA002 TaxID=2991715 RepID=UPI003FA453C3